MAKIDPGDALGVFVTKETAQRHSEASTTQNAQKRWACVATDARTCYDLRYYGYSPVMRGPNADHSEAVWLMVNADDDGECECPCHDEEDGDDEW